MQALRSELPEQEIIELVVDYERWGLLSDGSSIAALGERALDSPLLRAWGAWLEGDPASLAGGADPAFVFPYRTETIRVLEWAVRSERHWSWRYLLALNLWGRDRPAEAAAILDGLRDAPDYGPFYVTRAQLSGHTPGGGNDAESDLRRAIELDPDERLLRIPLITFLQEAGRWEDAIAVATAARERFPDDFNLALLHARSLNETERYAASIDILDAVQVLPSEHAGMSHRLFAEAHTMAALDALDADPAEAARHVEVAMAWPERLGQGRPYEPEERLQRFLLGIASRAAGDEGAALAAFEAVVEGTPSDVLDGAAEGGAGRLDLLAAVALAALGRVAELSAFGLGGDGPIGRVAAAVRVAAARPGSEGSDVLDALAAAVGGEPDSFADLEGRLLARAIALGR